ncbi:MAG: FAD binding domain-containing protein [Rhodomicrobium sp.]
MYFRARTVSEALEVLAEGERKILSGGTDFYPALVDRPMPSKVLDVSAIPEIAGIEVTPSEIRIGAGTRWSAIARAALPSCFRALQEAASEVGSIQIQNAGTIGGNLCNASPAADGVPPLLILDAEVEIAAAGTKRREPLSSFIQGNRRTSLSPGELLTAIIVPRTIERAPSKFLKLGARRYLVISIVMAAACIAVGENGKVADARVAVGACSAIACRLLALERALIGADARPGLGALVRPDHLTDLSPINDVRGTADYRFEAALQLIRNTIEACVCRNADG